VGHLLQGRYKSILVDKERYGLELCRYIVLNPARARMVKRPEHWKWSSYPATVGVVAAPAWLDAGWVLDKLGGRDAAAARFLIYYALFPEFPGVFYLNLGQALNGWFIDVEELDDQRRMKVYARSIIANCDLEPFCRRVKGASYEDWYSRPP